MMIARVIGTVVSTRKEPTMEGLRLLVCQPVNAEGEKAGTPVVAADAVGAGVGETILYATGSSARQTVATQNRPVDAVVMAIVDNWEVAGEYKYRKRDDKPAGRNAVFDQPPQLNPKRPPRREDCRTGHPGEQHQSQRSDRYRPG